MKKRIELLNKELDILQLVYDAIVLDEPGIIAERMREINAQIKLLYEMEE